MDGEQPQARLDRINELAKLAKERELTDAELAERKVLRDAYLKDFRAGFEQRMAESKYYDKKGNEITPEKLKDVQRKQGWRED
ncbi:DUF896 domain-containing protein [Lacticaseibacillus mingshuiensis]|uniref:UPF0291 protein ACFQ4P_06845 n=1 Tax=Lacticaseibacillus mingshuiensis TaxID=2799574 RepID=A0ABW4CK75_9LACO|nr:DUF896 domain-containing protein [Lacticaseibacillus mingshuiensis]